MKSNAFPIPASAALFMLAISTLMSSCKSGPSDEMKAKEQDAKRVAQKMVAHKYRPDTLDFTADTLQTLDYKSDIVFVVGKFRHAGKDEEKRYSALVSWKGGRWIASDDVMVGDGF